MTLWLEIVKVFARSVSEIDKPVCRFGCECNAEHLGASLKHNLAK